MVSTTPDGETDLRQYIQNNWSYVALIDDIGDVVTRIDVENDSRAGWDNTYENKPIAAVMTIKGDDADIGADEIGTEITLTATQSRKTDTSSEILCEDSATDALLASGENEVVIYHRIQYPTIEDQE